MDDEFATEGGPSTRAAATTSRRRSTRSSTLNNGNGSRATDDWAEWRGERRSARLGAPVDQLLDGPPPKRARTSESAASSADTPVVPPPAPKPIKLKSNGAAALKPTETVVEAVAGKKKSKFWVYAVEPIAAPQNVAPAAQTADVDMEDNAGSSSYNGYRGQRGTSSVTDDGDRASSAEARTNGDIYQKSLEGSLSPTSSMDES